MSPHFIHCEGVAGRPLTHRGQGKAPSCRGPPQNSFCGDLTVERDRVLGGKAVFSGGLIGPLILRGT